MAVNFDCSKICKEIKKKVNLKGSNGVQHSQLLGFQTLSIIRNSKYQKNNVSETGCFHPRV
jgi:hypothetical protein